MLIFSYAQRRHIYGSGIYGDMHSKPWHQMQLGGQIHWPIT